MSIDHQSSSPATIPATSAGSSVVSTSVWTTSADLFRRWQLGDPTALDDLVRTLSPVLWQLVRAYGLDRHRAEDVVQCTWLALVRRRHSITDAGAVGAWLTTTARREAWRTLKRDHRSQPADDEVLARHVPDHRSAEGEVVTRDEHARLWAGVNQLPERCRRLLRVVAFADRPDYAGIAADLGMPVGSIGPTRGRCLDKLRTLLVEQEGGGHG
ncbi:MAG TPA: sigma-70 family RNA polymerase sigma factor [Segeticoccus sp.]|uniref:RNA polymerase sigma factor n=1 Tax=Segeticoccus sp. TaxID=2706531 RepID=UPI002D80F072|nr:sigma-70 family RNA polymerase sigma factor [Segeticoccus sp.]HET8599483.1 sigma-70 family RNA polymerase sigma factor [Segeticoccus sp.]